VKSPVNSWRSFSDRFCQCRPSARLAVSPKSKTPSASLRIAARRAGQQIYYALNTTVVEDLLASVWDLFSSRTPAASKNGAQEKKS